MPNEHFSLRKGLVAPQKPIPAGNIPDSTRTELWNIFYSQIWRRNSRFDSWSGSVRDVMKGFLNFLWSQYFGQRIDQYPGAEKMVERLGRDFSSGHWWIPFDVFEFIFEDRGTFGIPSGDLSRLVNESLAGSAYMLTDGKFVERLPEEQMGSITSALHIPFASARSHFEKAFDAWRRRQEPDPAEVVREAIHGVEATCRELCKDPNADLAKALAALHKERPVHAALKQAIEKLYAWTGDEDGIRHSLKGKTITKVEKSEAQFALVTCSALATYLIARAEE